MTKITDLPPEVLSLILHYKTVSHMPISLWNCGNRRLQLLLSNGGVTLVELKDNRDRTTSRYPTMLRHLRQLRTLSIKMPRARLLEVEQLAHELQCLSSTLECLTISCPDAERVFLASTPCLATFFDDPFSFTNIRTLWSSGASIWNVAETFPRLHTLRLYGRRVLTCEDLSALPDSITKLRVQLPSTTRQTSDLSLLPRGLLDLHITGPETSDALNASQLHGLPPNLIRLRADRSLEVDRALLELLPRTLTQFPESFWVLTEAHAQVMPPSLTALTLDDVERPHVSQPWTDWLPQHLVTLNLNSLDGESLRLLPKTLRDLRTIHFNWTDVVPNYFPPLTNLYISDCSQMEAPNIKCLPPTLTHFRNGHTRRFAINAGLLPLLPVGLRSLNVIAVKGGSAQMFDSITDLPNLPPQLELIFLRTTKWNASPETLLQLSPTLTALRIVLESLDAPHIRALPRGLQKLVLLGTSQFPSTAFLDLPRTLTHLAIPELTFAAGAESNEALSGLPSLTILYVDRTKGEILPPVAFSALPSTLKELSWGVMNPEALAYLPPTLQNLSVSIDVLENEAIPLLPRFLDSICLTYTHFRLTAAETVNSFPPLSDVRFSPFQSSNPTSPDPEATVVWSALRSNRELTRSHFCP